MAKKKASALEADVSTGAGPATAVKNILLRIIAVFAASGLSVIGAGSLVGISVAQAVILAGALGVATVRFFTLSVARLESCSDIVFL
jgi:hypothetical protein